MVISAKQAAKKLNCNPETIRRWCRLGKIPYMIDKDMGGYCVEETIIDRCKLYIKNGKPTDDKPLDTIGSRLKALREHAALSIVIVAYDTHIDANNLSRIEKDKKVPSIPVLKKLAKFYGVTTDYLLCMDLEEDNDESKA